MDPSNLKPAESFLQHAEKLLLSVGDNVVKQPLSHASFLIALDQYMDSQTVVIVTPEAVDRSSATQFLGSIGMKYVPQVVFVACESGKKDTGPPLLKDKELIGGAASIYILGSEGNIEYKGTLSDDNPEACAALQNPSEIRFQ